MDDAPRPLDLGLQNAGTDKSKSAAGWGLLMKLAVSSALLALLAQKLEWQSVRARLAEVEFLPLLGGVTLIVVTIFWAALRWRLLVRQGEARMPLGLALRLTFTGMFVGQVLPATIGGDVVRGVLACRSGLAWPSVFAGVVLDRVTALLGSVLLIVAGLPWLTARATGGAVPLVWVALASIGLIVALIAGVCVDKAPLPSFFMRQRWVTVGLDLMRQVRRGLFSRSGAAALALSVLIHVTTVVVVMLTGYALGIDISIEAGFLVVPLAILAAAVPISLNGWGIREGVMVAGFALFGISSADALLVSVLLGFGIIIAVLPGSLTWLSLK
jgi:uncharacterized membrane protein YbhN (UPF0104 family)